MRFCSSTPRAGVYLAGAGAVATTCGPSSSKKSREIGTRYSSSTTMCGPSSSKKSPEIGIKSSASSNIHLTPNAASSVHRRAHFAHRFSEPYEYCSTDDRVADIQLFDFRNRRYRAYIRDVQPMTCVNGEAKLGSCRRASNKRAKRLTAPARER